MYRKQPDQVASCISFREIHGLLSGMICGFLWKKNRFAVDRILWRGGTVHMLSRRRYEENEL